MARKTRMTPGVDAMEGRSLMSGFGLGGLNLNRLATSTNPTIVADVAKIRTDQATLLADTKASASTLRADFQAIQAAIANSATVKAAQATLSADTTTTRTLLNADRAAIRTATTTAARTAARAQLRADQTTTATTLKADFNNIQAAINADPAVQAARAKLVGDTAVVTNDQSVLRADVDKLRVDLRAALGISST